jgi:hypothetical protein
MKQARKQDIVTSAEANIRRIHIERARDETPDPDPDPDPWMDGWIDGSVCVAIDEEKAALRGIMLFPILFQLTLEEMVAKLVSRHTHTQV